jgi:hypothetical protein
VCKATDGGGSIHFNTPAELPRILLNPTTGKASKRRYRKKIESNKNQKSTLKI